MLLFQGYSTIGKDHVRNRQRNQDNLAHACFGANFKQYVVCVVSDGCGSAPESHIGSGVLANIVVGAATSVVQRMPLMGEEHDHRYATSRMAQEVNSMAVCQLMQFLRMMNHTQKEAYDFACHKMLATYLCAIACDEWLIIFGVGDGIVCTPTETIVKEYSDNAPPYLAYWTMNIDLPEEWQNNPVVYYNGPWEKGQSAMVATDGLSPFTEIGKSLEPKGLQVAQPFGSLRDLLESTHSEGGQAILERQMRMREKRSDAFADDATLIAIHNL